MREIDLQHTLPCRRALAEYLENESCPVDDLRVPGALEVALLDGCQRMVDDHQLRVGVLEPGCDFLDLAGAEERGRPRPRDRRQLGVDDIEVDRLRKPYRFVEPGLSRSRHGRCGGLVNPSRTANRSRDDKGTRSSARSTWPGLQRGHVHVVWNRAQSPCQALPPASSFSNI